MSTFNYTESSIVWADQAPFSEPVINLFSKWGIKSGFYKRRLSESLKNWIVKKLKYVTRAVNEVDKELNGMKDVKG